MSPESDFIAEFTDAMGGRDDKELGAFFNQTMRLIIGYMHACQLHGTLCMVLDNSIVQDFKHRNHNPVRGVRALAYTAFCRFVTGWSDRETRLVLSPVIVYEHLGRQPTRSIRAATLTLDALRTLLIDTKLPIEYIVFSGPEELTEILKNIHHDSQLLLKLAQAIDTSSWKRNLKTPVGISFPLAIAHDALPDDLRLDYFDPWYVRHVFSSRIEQLIIDQSSGNPRVPALNGGPESVRLAKLNEIKRGVLTGLGDIDLLQTCDLGRQYYEHHGYVLVGQTFDKGLARVLNDTERFTSSIRVIGGSPNIEKQVSKMVDHMFSNPFAEEDNRVNQMRPKIRQFLNTLTVTCETIRSSH